MTDTQEAKQTVEASDNGAMPAGLAAKYMAVYRALRDVELKQSGNNEHLKYTYSTDSDMYEAVSPELAKVGLLLLPSLIKDHPLQEIDGQKATAWVRFRWLDPDTGDHWDEVWAGTGKDNMGLAPYKAYTGAIRTYLAKCFHFATNENPEDQKPQGAAQPIAAAAKATEQMVTAKQRGKINAEAGKAKLEPGQLANLIRAVAGEQPKVFETEEAAQTHLTRLMDRLPVRLMDPLLERIREDADVGA